MECCIKSNRLNLSIYTPSLFIFESEKGNYGIDYEGEGLTVDGREKGIRKDVYKRQG